MKKGANPSELVLAVFNSMNSRDFDLFEKTITDDVAFDFPGVGRVEGRRRTILLLKSILRKYPVLRFDVSETISEGERTCAVWTNRGTSADGSSYSNSGVTLIHSHNGKITFISDYFKDTSFAENR